MGDDRAGGTSQRCGNLPAAFFSNDFSEISNAPEPLGARGLLSKLADHGIDCGSGAVGRAVLGKMSYQHLLPYVKMLEGSGRTRTVEELHRIAVLDRKLQSLVLEYVGLFELQFRAQYSAAMSRELGPFAHREPANFKNRAHFDGYLRAYASEVSNQMRCGNKSIARSCGRYGDAPIWEAVEVMSLGMLSKLYRNTRPKSVRHAVADSFGATSEELSSWMRTLTAVRNRCAHFAPLLGQRLPYSPARIPGVGCDNTSPFYALLILERLLSSTEHVMRFPESCYGVVMAQGVADIFNAFSDVLDLAGIPRDWFDVIVSEPVLGIPVTEKIGLPEDGDFWFTIAEPESGRLVKFDRWGGRVVDTGIVMRPCDD